MAVHLVRVIAGTAGGRRLQTPAGRGTRPMMDRVKEAVFSSLGEAVIGARVLDLYAGSGSLGIEALSRGAASAVFVESNRRAAAVIQGNLAALRMEGRVVTADADRFLGSDRGRYDLVFVDPPYALKPSDLSETLGNVALRLEERAIVVVHRRAGGADSTIPAALTVSDRRTYGDAEVTRLTKEQA